MSAAAPLSGLVVVELGTSIAAPSGAMILAELGAEVIKVEPPGSGDDARNWGPPFANGASTVFNAFNRNKRSAAVDLKDVSQVAALRRFIADEVDIVVQNLRPGLVEKLGLDAATLRAEKPALIYCHLGAFGPAGPLRDRPGYDPLMQAYGGIMGITGEEGRPPVRVGPSLVDQGAGMWGIIGTLAALRRRDATGEGCEVGTSLYETALNWVSAQVSTLAVTGRPPRKLGTENAGIAPYRAFEASDGWLVIAAGNDNLFRRCAAALGRPEWTEEPRFRTNPDRVREREALNALVGEVVATRSRAEWLERLMDAGVPCAPVLALDEVVAEPQFEAIGMMQRAPDSDLSLLGLPLRFDGERPALRSSPPALGDATARVLGEQPVQPAGGETPARAAE
ncbi:CaiB/BaiF CoA transferase family protein [Muricoccus aerilatus]|uniref:CaiB/BaiF CoA transferase family protein n=1 Tax=Muricoccus aerilatus TaxID=452982 RepID=UPI000A038E6D|nr:CoA transferase [Roseomonas aerilata]